MEEFSSQEAVVLETDSFKRSRKSSSAILKSMMRSKACSCVDSAFDLEGNFNIVQEGNMTGLKSPHVSNKAITVLPQLSASGKVAK